MKARSARPCSASLLSTSFCHRLNAYAAAASAAGVGMLAAGAQTANAKVVYHHAGITVDGAGPVYLDLNNDGIKDFRFSDGNNVERPAHVHGASDAFSSYWLNAKPDQRANRISSAGQNCAAALRKDVEIGPSSPFQNASSTVRMAWGSNGGGQSCPWAGIRGAYLGVRFVIEGKAHYGWVRMNQPKNDFGFPRMIVGYAYESVAGKAILTGATSGADEAKGSLGALARGK
jgi:hypothetical protein